jgi:hypothetical protein
MEVHISTTPFGRRPLTLGHDFKSDGSKGRGEA